ncbi:MAG TPA: riboflavin biosynthesis protein RibF [Polyangiaceae bacterium]|jgi:riboflavin kinase/FMN adenylyltransferase|nr:MAG: Riboflavin biosynthesis protein RibF [Deltaproteobacteria bacterium ADurb.Bin207]HNS98535.1 riboflavin biosynthesis protein RibF [Polyangiaceae bacterium]HNZ21441.1 riboflavin biosynthesis protein RibF [Polyangiaceae bacterium]HOD23758.1 riboflavin biosynthesis protein RibF [Polyangiaceae bacterium]HOE51187.1 riboflavin biosynthesis protein RibF [Polyangiaceae bacterium]
MNYSHPLELGTMGARPEDFSGQPTLVAIGNFDGVHLGHQAVLVDTAAEAKSNGWIPVALTFEPHPTVAVGRPPPACLTPVQRKIELIQRIDPSLRVVVQTFDEPFATQSPEAFVRTMLVDRLCARGVRVGENFRFGARRSGDLDSLADFGKQFGFEARAVPLLGDHQGRFSSTRARHAVAIGDLDEVWAILSRPHALSGKVVQGQRRARSLGFPTANLRWVQEALPPHGVYAVVVDRLDEHGAAQRLGAGVCNIGIRPTVDAGFAVEVHLFDFDGDLYGLRLRAHLIHSLRSEKKFNNLDDLKLQIELDVQEARKRLASFLPSVWEGQAWF